jgi:hypothetical protein
MAIQKNWYLIGKQEFLLSVQSSHRIAPGHINPFFLSWPAGEKHSLTQV